MPSHGPQPNHNHNQYGQHNRVDVSQALDLKYNHFLSYDAVAKIQGVTKQAIHNRIKHLLPNNDTQYYQDHRANILSHIQLKLLSQVDSPRLKKVNIRDAVISAGILYDKERLERGQSTTNADMKILSVTLQELEAQERELKRSLGDLGVTGVRDDGDCNIPPGETRNDIKGLKTNVL